MKQAFSLKRTHIPNSTCSTMDFSTGIWHETLTLRWLRRKTFQITFCPPDVCANHSNPYGAPTWLSYPKNLGMTRCLFSKTPFGVSAAASQFTTHLQKQ